MTPREYITYVLRKFKPYGWRRLKRRWAPKKPLRRWYELRKYSYRKYQNALRRGRKARADLWLARHRQAKKKFAYLQKQEQEAEAPASGVGTYDGKPVAAWMIPWLEKSRRAGWGGSLVSGWRDPAYSEQLCYRIYGAPSCTGRCAGRASNHSGSEYPAGAVDVSDFYNFGAIQKRIGSPLINALGAQDPVHFSISGR
jgi:hypothetical protein